MKRGKLIARRDMDIHQTIHIRIQIRARENARPAIENFSEGGGMPTLKQAREQLDEKIRRWGENSHCNRLVVSEEARQNAIENRPDESGRRRTIISFQTYCPDSYSNWHSAMEYLMERVAYNPVLLVDLVLLLIQEARQQTETEGVDGIDIALASLFKVNGDYEERLREAKAQYRARKRK